jgi:membrane fusion protein (multidrug efflux system)
MFGTLIMNAGCDAKGNDSAHAAPPRLQVQVAEVQQRDVPLYREWIGTLDGSTNAEIKAQFPVIS